MNLSEEQIERYSRHILLQDVGGQGQIKFLKSKVLIIGAGGLGAPIALYLAAAGCGTLGIIDGDAVDITNLQRQVIHFTPDIGKPKVDSAKEKINQLNPDVEVITYHDIVTSHNILDIIKDYDFIIDGTDNFPAKFLINDACVILKKPFSHGGILRFSGQTLTVLPNESACYRCVFLQPPPPDAVPTCSQAGVLGALAGTLGSIQATEALKFILGKGKLLTNRLLTFDALELKFREVKVKKNKRCPICGENPTITDLTDYVQKGCALKK